MLKKLQLIVLLTLWLSSGLLAQVVVLTDEFDNGDGKWTSGWIDASTTTVTTSIDNTGKLSGANSYKLVVTKGSADTWRIQRNADLPLQAGYQYTLSFMAVASKNASINVLFEIAGDPYTKRLNETPQVTTTAQTFTYTMSATENVPTNQVKLHFGGTQNDGSTIWVDKILVTRIQDPGLVASWGSTPRGTNGWTILNTAATPAGSGSMGGTAKPTGWMSIKGGFNPLTATTSQAFVITGTFEFVGGGGGSAYTWLRYALFNEPGTLNGQNTPTAAWTEDANGNGYIFTPVSGTGTISNTYNTWPQGGVGTEWPLVNSKSWTSTNSNGGGPYSTILQAPNRQVATAGVYDWAMSVQPLSNGTNEVRWYFVQQHTAGSQNYYWWGGSFIDAVPLTTSFNSIGFGVNSDIDATCKQVNLANVHVSLGAPITIPTAPWQAFYVDQWGSTPRGTNGWTILNNTTYVIGDAAMGGTAAPTGWMSIKGGFNPITPATAAPGKAFIISGTFEFVGGGGGNAYTWLRYALFNEDGALSGQNTPTAAWTETSNGNGYIFTPVTGTGTISNTYNTWPQGGVGTEWPLINSKSWNSTNTNGGGPYSTILQKPNRQVAVAGVYDWAISVQPLSNGTNEVRWYFIQKHTAGSPYYWWGGSFIDAVPLTTKFNSIGFAVNSDIDATCKQVNIRNVKVDMGNPITVPKAPWVAYYTDKMGFYGGIIGGWKYTPDVIGNATISGTTALALDKWTTLRAGFIEPISGINKDTALVVTGKVEFVGGGFQAPNSFLVGLNYTEKAGNLITTPADSTRWNGTDDHNYGYLFIPRSGNSISPLWPVTSQYGNFGAVVDRPWASVNGLSNYVLGNVVQKPANAVGAAGVYNFAVSVAPQGNGTSQIKFLLNNNSYQWGGSIIDNHNPLATQRFNGLTFVFGGGNTTTALKFTDIKVDYAPPLPVSVKPNEGLSSSIPADYALNQNYPNPFNPTTTIEIALPQNSNVKLIVYDVLGRVVAELANGSLTAGYHKFDFNAANLSSGIYFYSLKAGDFYGVKKLVLLK